MDNHNGVHGFYMLSFFPGNKKTWTSNVQRNIFKMRQEWLIFKNIEYTVWLLVITYTTFHGIRKYPCFFKIKTVSHLRHTEPICL